MKKALALLLLFCLLLTAGMQNAARAESEASATSTPPSMPTPTAISVILSAVSPSPTPTPALTPSPSPAKTPTPEPTPFTIVWMSDTQNMTRDQVDVLDSMRDWILANREKENIQFVIHTGDVIDGFTPAMFENAAAFLVPILEMLPGMVVSGNHDVSKDGSQWYFTQRPYAQLVQKEGQTYRDGAACYVTFRAGRTDFLVFGIGYSISCPGWMQQIISEHPEHVVITVIHSGMAENGHISGPMKAILQEVAPLSPRFRLMLCGHMRGSATRIDRFDDDHDGEKERSVTTMMFNYQEDRVNGLGFLRLLRFDPLTRSIEVSTYSPWFDQWGYPKTTDQENHFILENAW